MLNTNIREGIILIVDFKCINGLSPSTELYTAKYIIQKLFSALKQANNGYFYISKIDGSIGLLYKYRRQPYYKSIVDALRKMQVAFSEKKEELNQTLGFQIGISLKLIVHYGRFSRQRIKVVNELYGEAVDEAHHLLEREDLSDLSYILFSNSFFKKLEDSQYNVSENKVVIPDVGTIYYFDL